MKKIKSSAVVVLASVLSLPALAVTISQDNRFVSASGQVSSFGQTQSWSSQQYAPSSGADFNYSYSETNSLNGNTATTVAHINSSMEVAENSLRVVGSGSANSSADTQQEQDARFRYTDGDTRSEQDFRFTITNDMYFSLSGSLAYNEVSGNTYGGARVSLRNTSYSNNFDLSLGDGSSSSSFARDFLLAGLLDAGTYTFEIYADSRASVYSSSSSNLLEVANASYNFEFVLGNSSPLSPSAVPVPAAAWLFGSALLGLVGIKRKK